MEKEFNKDFPNCPACGAEDSRFFETMGEEMKERGLGRPEWHFHLDIKQGVVADSKKEAAISIGSEVPAYGMITDVCMECGCMWATGISRSNVKKSVQMAPPPQPNRAQRRQMGRLDPPLSNPFN